MVQKLKDAANLLYKSHQNRKAKMKQDELQEMLVNVVSQQNWQASTKELHEVCNAAYNYEKWERIKDFIWDKLKKNKSWKKILKTLTLVQFLLKNGPSSIIPDFKYEIYQFRSFDNYSHVSDGGLDKGEAIRERSKAIVDLLSNQQLLQDERSKAKQIRDRMSDVSGISPYGGGTTYGGTGSYGGIGSSSGYVPSAPKQPSFTPGGVGLYGNYNDYSSTLNKYKDNPTSTTSGKTTTSTKKVDTPKKKKQQQVQPQPVENKKPFERLAPKLSKPGAKPTKPKEQTEKPKTTGTTGGNLIDDDVIFGATETTPASSSAQDISFPVPPPTNTTTTAPTTTTTTTNNTDFGITFESLSQTAQVTTNSNQQIPINLTMNTPMNLNAQQPNTNQFYQQNYPNQQVNFPNMGQPNMQQPNMNQNQWGNMQQPMYPNTQAQNPNFYQQPPPQPVNNFNFNISLSTSTPAVKKDEQQWGTFQSSQPKKDLNAKWLSSQEKGLIDLTDLGDSKPVAPTTTSNSKKELSNNIDTTWNW